MGSLCTRKLDLYMRECVRDPFVQTNLHLSCPDLSTAHWSSTLVNGMKTNTNASINTNTSLSNQQIPFLQKQERKIFQTTNKNLSKTSLSRAKTPILWNIHQFNMYTTCSNKEILCFSNTTIASLYERQIVIFISIHTYSSWATNTSLSKNTTFNTSITQNIVLKG